MNYLDASNSKEHSSSHFKVLAVGHYSHCFNQCECFLYLDLIFLNNYYFENLKFVD